MTFGIYFIIWIYKAMREYQARAGRQGGNLDLYFWGMIACTGASLLLFMLTVFLYIVAIAGSVAFFSLLVYEVLKDRDAIAARIGLTMLSPLPNLMGIFIASNVLSATICGAIAGLPLFAWFCYQFFAGHNQLITALEATDSTPA